MNRECTWAGRGLRFEESPVQESVHSMSLARGTQLQQLNEKKEKKHVRLGGEKEGNLTWKRK